MTKTWKLKEVTGGKVRTFQTKADAQEAKADLEQLGVELELIPPGEEEQEQNGAPVAEPQETDAAVVEPTEESLPDQEPDLEQDPVDWMPSHFIDNIQGVPTVNRKGYCVIAARFGVSVTAEPRVSASETDFQYAEFQAIARTEDGCEYSGFGSAHVDRGDGDDPYLLNELAETRALKRAVAWATGIGMTAVEEMRGRE